MSAASKGVIPIHPTDSPRRHGEDPPTPCHPTSALTRVTGRGELPILPREQVAGPGLGARPSPKEQGHRATIQVLSIDLPVRRGLVIQICEIPQRFFTDQMVAVEDDGRWQIRTKGLMNELRD